MDEKETREFWNEIERQISVIYRVEQPIFILSPAQARRYQLAHLRVPKYKNLLVRRNEDYKYIIVDTSLFDRNFDEWQGLGLIDKNGLEEKYINKFPPAFMGISLPWHELIAELNELIQKRVFSERFARLWSSYLQKNQIMLFLGYFEPYKAATKSMEENESSEVERYIYAHWLHNHSYTGKRGEKSRLGTSLASKLDEVLCNYRGTGKRPWQFIYYESLILTENEENPLIRTVTDMTPLMIVEYATDGAFSKSDFPELFSVT